MAKSRSEDFRQRLKKPEVADYETLLEELLEEFFAERGCLWLERENVFLYRGDEELRSRFPFSRQAFDEALEKQRGFISLDVTQDERIAPDSSMLSNNLRSCMCAAARDEQGAILVLAYFDNGTNFDGFHEHDLELLLEVLALVPGACAAQ